MGCCLLAALLIGAPRLGLFVWWFADSSRFSAVFPAWTLGANLGVPGWALPVLGFFLLPWTTVAYVFVAPGGVVGWEWLVLVLGLLLDLSTHGGGGAAYRRRPRRDY